MRRPGEAITEVERYALMGVPTSIEGKMDVIREG